jgi:DNA-binding response OmpR family regulator
VTPQKPSVLIIDDEIRYVRAIKFNLEASGYRVISARDGESGIEIAVQEKPDLILLDLRLPGKNGYDVCQELRQTLSAPIIMFTAMAEEANKVKGLELGADDYITKPFGVEELLARIRAVMRRYEQAVPTGISGDFVQGGLRVDANARRVFVDGHEINMTPVEFRLLCELIKQPGKLLVPEYLLAQVWGDSYVGTPHVLWQAIYRLRKKIERDPQNPAYILTRPGIGYIFAGSEE